MKILLLGPPGAGKGTQADCICKSYNIPKISTGDMLRDAINARTSIGVKAKKIISQGKLVSDNIIIQLVQERIAKNDCKNGFLFDGFPRTITQAQSLIDSNIDVDFVIEIYISDLIVLERLSGRRIHIQSGRTYHIKHNPPKMAGKDDVTGENLIIRDDDKESVIQQRLKIYHEQTELLVKFYLNMFQKNHFPIYIKIDGDNSVENITKELLNKLF